jgi:hypothetical protein
MSIIKLGDSRALRTLAIGAALLASGQLASAQSMPGQDRFEISPFVGYRVAGNFTLVDTGESVGLDAHTSFGLALDARAEQDAQYELFYSHQSTTMHAAGFAPVGIDVDYLHIGGTVAITELGGPLKPYYGGGLGMTHLSPGPAGSDHTAFSMSLALGLHAPVSRHFSLRFEGRGFVTLLNADTSVFCRSDQTGTLCQVHARGSSFLQFEMLAGAAWTF